MEKTQKRLGREILIGYAVIAALLALMIVVGELSTRGVLLDSRGMTATAGNAARILFFGALIGVICRIRRLKRTLADQTLLREEQIRQEDERARFIEDRSGARAMNALLVLLAAAVFVLAYVDMAAFRTAYGTLLAAAALRFGLKAYYKHKY